MDGFEAFDRPNDWADRQDRANRYGAFDRPDNRANRKHGFQAYDRPDDWTGDDWANPDDFYCIGLGRQQAAHQTGLKGQMDDRGLREHGISPTVECDEAGETTLFRLGKLSIHLCGQRVLLILKREELRLVCAHL
jgi:hypothetical protein